MIKGLLVQDETKCPICPYCKGKMEPVHYSGYYEDFYFWGCDCDELPDAKDEYGHV